MISFITNKRDDDVRANYARKRWT